MAIYESNLKYKVAKSTADIPQTNFCSLRIFLIASILYLAHYLVPSAASSDFFISDSFTAIFNCIAVRGNKPLAVAKYKFIEAIILKLFTLVAFPVSQDNIKRGLCINKSGRPNLEILHFCTATFYP